MSENVFCFTVPFHLSSPLSVQSKHSSTYRSHRREQPPLWPSKCLKASSSKVQELIFLWNTMRRWIQVRAMIFQNHPRGDKPYCSHTHLHCRSEKNCNAALQCCKTDKTCSKLNTDFKSPAVMWYFILKYQRRHRTDTWNVCVSLCLFKVRMSETTCSYTVKGPDKNGKIKTYSCFSSWYVALIPKQQQQQTTWIFSLY